MKKVTYPRMGHYTEIFEMMTRGMGLEPITPPETTQETIKLGVRHSSDMMCFPFKTTLGNLIQGLEAGADTLVLTAVNPDPKKRETCRFSFYYYIQEQILRRLGYEFETIYLDKASWNLVKTLKTLNPDIGTFKVIKLIKSLWDKIKEIEDREYKFERKDINIGIVGEIYTLWEQSVNYDIVAKLHKMGVGVDLSLPFSLWIKHQISKDRHYELYLKDISKYLPKPIGGHGTESLYFTMQYAKRNFDGVIHLLPLSCMPETLIEMPMNFISEDYGIPVYRFPIDENKFEAGFDTRLETFIKLLKRNKNVARN